MKSKNSQGAAPRLPQYLGKNKQDSMKFTDGEWCYLVKGVCAPMSHDDGDWSTSSGAFNNPAKQQSQGSEPPAKIYVFLAQGARTKKLYIVEGSIHRTWLRAPKTSGRKKMSIPEYEEEMKRVKAIRDAGGDAEVGVAFTEFHANRSFATIYRDINAGLLERPTKCGSSSRWKFSVVDAYASGTRPATGA